MRTSCAQNKDIKYKVTPVLGTLRKVPLNPLAVTNRLSSKRGDYNKVQTARLQNDVKNLDIETLQNAEDYVSLHAQLLEELPPFLQGMDKLMKILLGAFSRAQRDYFNGMQAHLRKFFDTAGLSVWGEEMDSSTAHHPTRPQTGPGSVPDGKVIMQLWCDAWNPENERIWNLGLASSMSYAFRVPSARL